MYNFIANSLSEIVVNIRPCGVVIAFTAPTESVVS